MLPQAKRRLYAAPRNSCELGVFNEYGTIGLSRVAEEPLG
jgi:hypothetical protein